MASSHPRYELLYHPGIPGRGEYIRLAFEAAGVKYVDVATQEEGGYAKVQALMNPKSTGDEDGNPVCFAPPMLRVQGAGKNGKDLVIHQTPNILQYISPRIGMAPSSDSPDTYHIAALALTALDLSNECHDTHHPIAVMQYYEDQKPAALAKATDFRTNRIPKFLSYFERVLKGNSEGHGEGKGKWLVGESLTYADTTLWQVLDGLKFAFPKEMAAREGEFPGLLGNGGFYERVKDVEGIKAYLESERRQKYSMGIYRYYAELDRQ